MALSEFQEFTAYRFTLWIDSLNPLFLLKRPEISTPLDNILKKPDNGIWMLSFFLLGETLPK